MNYNESLEIDGAMDAAYSGLLRLTRQSKQSFALDLAVKTGNPQAILMLCYHSCRDIRGSMKILHACRYLRDPDLYEMCRRIQASTRKQKRGFTLVDMSSSLRESTQEYPEIGFLGLVWSCQQ